VRLKLEGYQDCRTIADVSPESEASFGYVRGTTFHEVEAVRPWESMSNCMIVSRIWLCAQEAAQMLDF
jgi:hypothetical protein